MAQQEYVEILKIVNFFGGQGNLNVGGMQQLLELQPLLVQQQ